jgi:hypothetical protein
LISLEQNSRASNPPLATRFNEQSQALTQNLQEFRDRVGPEVFSSDPAGHGDTLMQAYQNKAEAADAVTGAKYQALRDANGGKFPLDAPTLKANVDKALDDQMLLEHAPSAEMTQLKKAADAGNMTFEKYEYLRTNLARIMRSSSDGNERAAAGVIREQMEQLPMSSENAHLKELADTARASARTQFQALEADPAYKAAVRDKVSPEQFVQRYVIGGSRDQIQMMRDNLSDNPQAQQTMGVAMLDHLRSKARIDSQGNGNFAQASFNNALDAQRAKLPLIFDAETNEGLSTLGNVARYTQFQPRGSSVNNSNTAVTLMGEHAKGLLEHGTNAYFGGFPVGTATRKVLQGRAARAFARDSLEIGAGLTDVP